MEYFISSKSLTFYDRRRKAWTVTSDHVNFTVIRDHLINDTGSEQELTELANVETHVLRQIADAERGSYLPAGKVSIRDGEIYYDNIVVDSALTRRMLQAFGEGHDLRPWILFMENLYLNPNHSTRVELYEWMAACDMPLTSDGHFLAYKRVTNDYLDFHSRTMSNKIGETVEMEDRAHVDPNRSNHCSRGLHFCSPGYLPHFNGGAGRILVLKINPADVVAIPNDYDFTKGRTWKYLVIGELADQADVERVWPAVSDWVEPIYEPV